MINYVIKITLGTEEVQAVICSRIGDDFFNVFQLLSSKDSNFDSVLLSSSESVSYPYLVCSSEGKLITPIYTLLKKCNFKASNELAEGIVAKLEGKGLDLTVENLRALEKCCSEFEQYINGKKVKIQIPSSRYDNFSRTKNLVKEINSSGEARTVYIEGENKTLFRKSVDDELFVRVPSYEDLYENLVSLNPRQICEPYKSAELRTPSFRDYLESYSMSIDEVLGNSENNNVEILPQETRYKNALIKLMEVGTVAQNSDVSLEDCKEQNIGSTLVLKYFKQLAMCAVAINWSHSGFMPKGYEDIDNGDEDDDRDTPTKDENSALGNIFWSAKGFESGHGKFNDDPELINGSNFINDLMDEMFQNDVYSTIDFIIRLFRFGKMKPSRIKINDNEYVDLTKFIIHKTSGNYSSIDFLTESDGSNLFPLSSIRMTDMMIDRKYISSTNVKQSSIDMNIGLICERRFKGDSFRQKILLSFLDLVKIYESSEPMCRIKGISLVDGKFIFSTEAEKILEDSSYGLKDLISLVKMKTDEFQFYCYSEFKDPFMEKTCWDRKISILDIVDRFYSSKDLALTSACDYASIEELDDLCTKFQTPPRAIIEMNIASYALPIFCDVSLFYEQGARSGECLTSAYVAGLFKKVMITRGFTGKFGTEAVEKIKTSVKRSSAFSENNNDSDGRKKFLDNVIESSEGSSAFYSLSLKAEILSKIKGSMSSLVIDDVDTATGSSIVGYIAVKEVEGKKIKIFIHPSEKPAQVRGSIDILKTCPAIMGILAKSLEGSAPSNRFADTSSGIYYCSLGNVIYNYLATRELS